MYVNVGGKWRLATRYTRVQGGWRNSGSALTRKGGSWLPSIYTSVTNAVVTTGSKTISGGKKILGFSSASYNIGLWGTGSLRGSTLSELWIRVHTNGNVFDTLIMTTRDGQPIRCSDGVQLIRGKPVLLCLKKPGNDADPRNYVNILMVHLGYGTYIPVDNIEFSTHEDIANFANSATSGVNWSITIVPAHNIEA